MVAMLNDPGRLEEIRKRIIGPGGIDKPVERFKQVESRIFKHLAILGCNAGSWREWSLNFLTTLGGNNGPVADALNEVLQASAAPLAKDLLDRAVPAQIKGQHSGELFMVL
jgi:hypothetical protein